MIAVTGYEQAMTDSLLTLLPGSTRDRAGNVTLVLGGGAPRRLVACPLDELGYVVGNVLDDGYLTLRRVGTSRANPLFDQQLEGHRVTLVGGHGPVPGVVAVRSTHLNRGRPAATDPPFTVDNAYVDVGAQSADEVAALGLRVLTPVALAKRPHRYGARLLAAAVLGRPRVRGTVVAAFTVQSQYATNAGLGGVKALQGPFDEVKELTLPVRFPDTAVETVSLAEAEALRREVVAWLGGGR
ncbi:MAG: hypothetical protein ACREL9_11725 [Gemmatimonadales bacterium]